MDSTVIFENVSLTIPDNDIGFLRALAKKMGWTMKRQRKSGVDRGLEDIKKGNVFHAENSEDLINQILG